MSPLVLWAAALVGPASACVLLGLALSARPPGNAEVLGNLSRAVGRRHAGRAPLARTQPLGPVVERLRSTRSLGRLERLLSLAGRPPAWSLGSLLIAKVLLGVAAGVLAVLYLSAGLSTGRLLLAAGFVCGAFFVPDLLLLSRAQERQAAIAKQLADTLDQMTISVEAGLGFDTAMTRAARSGSGPLPEELVRTLQELQVGVPRRTALRSLGERTTVEDLRRFVHALLQADTYGIPLADILRTQAKEVRSKRRSAAEQRAMQIPVKVVFPLVVCILPTLFIVLLGPAVLDIIGVFAR